MSDKVDIVRLVMENCYEPPKTGNRSPLHQEKYRERIAQLAQGYIDGRLEHVAREVCSVPTDPCRIPEATACVQGTSPYPLRDPNGEVRVMYTLRPTRILTFGPVEG